MGALGYTNGVLTGLGDDNADLAINGTDVVSDLSSLVANGATSVNVVFDHCVGGSPEDNHVWLMMLVYTSQQCDVVLDLGPDTAFCTGGSLLLDATQIPFANYTWQDGSTSSTYNVTQGGDYSVHVITAQCDRYDTIHVDVSAPPVFDLGNDTIVCAGTPVVLDATSVPAGTVTWPDGSTGITYNVNGTGTFWAEVNNAGCVTTDTAHVTVLPIPLALLPTTVNLCIGDSAILDAGNAGNTFAWSTGAVSQTIGVNSSGTYAVTVTNAAACSTTDSTQVIVHQIPVVQLGPDTSLCVGEQWQMDAGNGGSTFTWNTGAHTQLLTISTSQVMWVHVTSAFGCTSGDTISVTFDPLPAINLQDDSLCISQTALLDAGNPGSQYLWSTGATTQSISISGTGGTFSVLVTGPTFCMATDTATIAFVQFPIVDLGLDSALCAPDTLWLDAGNAGMLYTWSNGTHNETNWVHHNSTVWVDVDNGFCAKAKPLPPRLL